MSLFTIIREPVPDIRTTDGLTLDHPDRSYPLAHPVRHSAWLRGVVFVAVFLVMILVGLSVVFAIYGSVTLTSPVPSALTRLVAALAAYVVLAMVMEGRVWPLELQPRRWLGLLKGMLVAAIILGASLGIIALLGSYRVTGVNPHYNVWTDLITLGVVAAVSEEILLRAGLFRLAEEGLGTWGAAVVSALIFGALHLTNQYGTWWGALAIALEAGLLLAGVYALTRSLWWCVGLHFAWNMLEGPLFGSIVSGGSAPNSWLVSSWTNSDLVTGGMFGMEGSVVVVTLCGLIGIALLVYAQRRGLMVAPLWVRKARSAAGE